MPKTAPELIFRAKNLLESEDPFFWLARIEPNLTETIYLTTNNETVVFDPGDGSVSWFSFPFAVASFEEDGQGSLSEFKISVSNVTFEIGRTLLDSRGFTGRPVTMYLMLKSIVGGAITESFRWNMKIQSVAMGEDGVGFTLGRQALNKMLFPAQRAWRTRCGNGYKGATWCTYTGTLPTCDLTLRGLNGCEAHDNQSRYHGFPGIPKK